MLPNILYFILNQVCKEWKEIALVCRDRVFEENEQEDVDLFDLKVRVHVFSY